MSDNSGHFEPGVVYFTTRRLKNKWVAERVELVGDSLVRTMFGEPGGRIHAMNKFRIAVDRYWREQQKAESKKN